MRSHVSSRLSRLSLQGRLITPLQQTRSYHVARAQFITINEEGNPTPSDTEIRIGDPHQAFIYIEPRLGDIIKSTVIQQTGLGNTQDLKKLPMVFHHASRHFSHSSVPYPRVEIFQDLPRQTTGDTSPATLWTSFNWHAFTLDGSPEEEFEKLSRESGEDWKELLEMLSRT